MDVVTLSESTTGPIILWGMYPHRGNELEETKTAITETIKEGSYTLIAFQVSDWNREFSLWKTDTLDVSFSGDAQVTLQYLLENVVPAIKKQYGEDRKLYIMGYSLAGAFALWVMYQTDVFAGAASCSGSLWYPGLVSYVQEHHLAGRRLYFSLGGKEANTKNELMATVATCTKKIVNIVKQDNVAKYEQNAGGHFADAGKRLAKAVHWLLL